MLIRGIATLLQAEPQVWIEKLRLPDLEKESYRLVLQVGVGGELSSLIWTIS
jgi:hypothetical protein